MHCDFAFWVGGTHENVDELAELERLPGAAGIKVFMGSSTGSLLVEDDAGVGGSCARTRRRAAFHSEDERLAARAPRAAGRRAIRPRIRSGAPPRWRSPARERLVRIAREQGARIHVLHVSTAEEMRFLAGHKDVASVEVTPHHLTLVAPDCYERLGTYAQMNPPVRDAAHRDGVWRGVAQGVADILGSDHAPHTREEKAQALSGHALRHDRRADAGADHARPRERRPADAGALRRHDERRTGARSSASPARAASPSATTPTSPWST